MCTTIAIDDDLVERLREEATKRHIPLTRLVNEMLRHALSGQSAASQQRAIFRVEAFESDFRPGVDPLHLNKLVDDIEIRWKHRPAASDHP